MTRPPDTRSQVALSAPQPIRPDSNHSTIPANAADLLKPSTVGRMLAITPRYALILAERGKLACVRIGAKAVRFRREDVEAFVAAHRQPATLATNEAAAVGAAK